MVLAKLIILIFYYFFIIDKISNYLFFIPVNSFTCKNFNFLYKKFKFYKNKTIYVIDKKDLKN